MVSNINLVNLIWLVGGLEHEIDFSIYIYIGNFIIPIDEVIFVRGVGQPPTRYKGVNILGISNWLVVSNMFYFPCHIWHMDAYGLSSFPLTNSIIFQDGYCTTNQPKNEKPQNATKRWFQILYNCVGLISL